MVPSIHSISIVARLSGASSDVTGVPPPQLQGKSHLARQIRDKVAPIEGPRVARSKVWRPKVSPWRPESLRSAPQPRAANTRAAPSSSNPQVPAEVPFQFPARPVQSVPCFHLNLELRLPLPRLTSPQPQPIQLWLARAAIVALDRRLLPLLLPTVDAAVDGQTSSRRPQIRRLGSGSPPPPNRPTAAFEPTDSYLKRDTIINNKTTPNSTPTSCCCVSRHSPSSSTQGDPSCGQATESVTCTSATDYTHHEITELLHWYLAGPFSQARLPRALRFARTPTYSPGARNVEKQPET
ncbi:hypothetical protein G7046_g6089 [Stylonectria norvegica]|nr:hypothetical protein G7046_g6089 [Stylonectria norvegica]